MRLERVQLAAHVERAAVDELCAPHELLDGALVEVEREALARDTRGGAALQRCVAHATAASVQMRAGLECGRARARAARYHRERVRRLRGARIRVRVGVRGRGRRRERIVGARTRAHLRLVPLEHRDHVAVD